MHQQIHCHTLPKPFSQIFLFRIYAPTNTHTTQTIDPAPDETSVRHPQISTPIQPPQTNPPTTRMPRQPPQMHAAQASTDTHPHRHTRRRAGPTLTQSMHSTLTPLHRRSARLKRAYSPAFRPDTHSQPRCTRSHAPVRNWTGQADRIRPYKTRPDRIRPPIHN